MSSPGSQAKLFLESLHNEETKSTFEHLNTFIELLENKVDPDPTELRLLGNIYQFVEKLKFLENNMSTYVKESRKNLSGNKLSDLYDSAESYGSSKLFKD
jgi:hypothetical protein